MGFSHAGNMENTSDYVEAVIRGPKLETPYFGGDDSVEWFKHCEQFFTLLGTPREQWVNLATSHL